MQHRPMSARVVGGRVLHLPVSSLLHGERPVGRCDVVVNADGGRCGTLFYDRTKWLRHVARCSVQHESAINAYRKRTHPDIMRAWDPELEAWMAQNARAVLEGKMKA
jgi:uncharacterized C2H2 Zn-finger protein